MEYSLQHRDGFEFPSLTALLEYEIVVCALMTSGKLFAVGVPPDHFTHLFVDEDGHATEADLMVALQSASCLRHMMLARDPKQLGAVVRAPPCIGMSISPLQRLQSDPSMHDQVTMLTDNYRSHPAIVNIVNVAYDDKFIPAAPADPIFRHSSLRVTIPNAKNLSSSQETMVLHIQVSNSCPVTFLHHNGQDSREQDSPSWLNITEA
jgi:helicase MOV-10